MTWRLFTMMLMMATLGGCGGYEGEARIGSTPRPSIDIAPEKGPSQSAPVSANTPGPLPFPVDQVGTAEAEPIAEPEARPYWCAKNRYRESVYVWERWQLREVLDSDRTYSHVRIEFDGVLQFLSTGSSGYALSFFDSEDFAVNEGGGERHRPPMQVDAPTWQLNGAPSDLVVEDLTGTGGATLVLLEWTGGNQVFRQVSFLHLQEDGHVRVFGPFSTAMEIMRSERVGDQTTFVLHDGSWMGWYSCQAGSAHPEVRVTLAGGKLRSCNSQRNLADLLQQEQRLKELAREQEQSENDLRLYLFARDVVLDLVYCGQLDQAKRVLREHWVLMDISEYAESRCAQYWSDIITATRSSSLFRLLDEEFPQIEDEYYALPRESGR